MYAFTIFFENNNDLWELKFLNVEIKNHSGDYPTGIGVYDYITPVLNDRV